MIIRIIILRGGKTSNAADLAGHQREGSRATAPSSPPLHRHAVVGRGRFSSGLPLPPPPPPSLAGGPGSPPIRPRLPLRLLLLLLPAAAPPLPRSSRRRHRARPTCALAPRPRPLLRLTRVRGAPVTGEVGGGGGIGPGEAARRPHVSGDATAPSLREVPRKWRRAPRRALPSPLTWEGGGWEEGSWGRSQATPPRPTPIGPTAGTCANCRAAGPGSPSFTAAAEGVVTVLFLLPPAPDTSSYVKRVIAARANRRLPPLLRGPDPREVALVQLHLRFPLRCAVHPFPSRVSSEGSPTGLARGSKCAQKEALRQSRQG